MTWFERPSWLWLAAGITLVAVVMDWRGRRMARRRMETLGQGSPGRPHWRFVVLLAGILLLVVASAGPRRGAGRAVATAQGRDLIIVIDASRSMFARDVLPDRYTHARNLAMNLVEKLRQRGGWQVGVVAFAGQAVTTVPLTYDLAFVRSALLEDAPMPRVYPDEAVSGTRMGAALRHAGGLLKAGRPGAGSILLFSDGDDPARDGDWSTGCDVGVPVDVIGIGTEQEADVPGVDARSRLQAGPLREIASRTGGRIAMQHAAIGPLEDAMVNRGVAGGEHVYVSHAPARPGPFIILGMALIGLSFLTPRRRSALAVTGILAVAAGPIEDWLRRGNDELAAGRPAAALRWYDRAAERTPDPGQVAFNQGVAFAALGRYREAELHFRRALTDASGLRRARALYNLGTAMVRRGAGQDRRALQDAVTAFEAALATANDELAADIRANLRIAKELVPLTPDAPNAKPQTGDAPDARPPAGDSTEAAAKDGNVAAAKVAEKGPANAGQGERETNLAPTPGRGNLPPVPDVDELQPIAPEDLAAYLRQTELRILKARAEQVKVKSAPKRSYPDW